jgi:hypothetical protein
LFGQPLKYRCHIFLSSVAEYLLQFLGHTLSALVAATDQIEGAEKMLKEILPTAVEPKLLI